MKNAKSTIYAQNPSLIVKNVGGESIVYDRDSSNAVSLNQLTFAIWELCNGENSVNDIAVIVSDALKGEVDTELIGSLLRKLEDENLIEP
ncbi:MAG: PqqD family protein, partial [Pyrinomonadaceae bacterium]|nr:PqqD family protein [Pyrinomonadaceae bacterium]